MKKLLVYGLIGLLASSAIAGLLNRDRGQSLNAAPRPQAPADETAAMPKPMRQMHDRHFIEMMIPHHEGAIALAQLAPGRAKHPEIESLATSIIQNQTSEINQMRNWYKKWYKTDVPVMSAGRGMTMDLAALKQSDDFDRAFIQQMIPHHQMAVHMAQMLLKHTTRPEMQRQAESIIKSQTAEIHQMHQWQQTWYPNSQQSVNINRL